MTRLHLHVSVKNLEEAIGFCSGLFEARPRCAGSSYANWRVDDPPVNFAASVSHRPEGPMHFDLEVDNPADLPPIDHVSHGPFRPSAAVPWEVSVRNHPVQKEDTR